ncbi:ArsR/SmtB family transcription factor [Zunongwangia pacifica]|uniref:Metalloregulator ArsR/SmtB family transcription factor n=1 Tax=Zunongwangia pacifica TaxID=2911062 RepID=A0A9X1ZSR0_9FLAO|nr:metalloregulator ArsR/SmtB family transcription factor [Zunongwangia pacifica]MCL6219279.1 metalloregulator ArsR/SmtB family transcription factor [Zunongwangia pacifica]
MGVTKSEIFSESQNQIATIAKVLGHPARIAILQQIIKAKSCICGDLVTEIGLAQPTISQHLRELKNIGIIKGDIEGTRVCYCIDEDKWGEIRDILTNFFQQDICGKECC